MARKTTKFRDYVREQLKNPAFRRHFEDYELPVKIAVEIALLRRKRKMTQAQLAKKLGVKQQMVAQLENPEQSTMPNVRTLQRVAHALGVRLQIGFQP